MAIPEGTKGTRSISEYISSRVGISMPQATRVVKALSEFITINLSNGFAVNIQRVGVLSLVFKNKIFRAAFNASTDLLEFNKEYRKTAPHPYLRKHNLDIVPSPTKRLRSAEDYLQRQATYTQDKVHRLSHVKKIFLKDTNYLRLNFLRYLQQQFPYGHSWTHPTTGNVYEAEAVYKKIAAYKELDPDGFKLLWLVWVGNGTRIKTRQNGLASSNIKSSWHDTVDSLMLLILFSDLEPTLLVTL